MLMRTGSNSCYTKEYWFFNGIIFKEMQQIVLMVEHQILKEAVRLYYDHKLEVAGERVNIKWEEL